MVWQKYPQFAILLYAYNLGPCSPFPRVHTRILTTWLVMSISNSILNPGWRVNLEDMPRGPWETSGNPGSVVHDVQGTSLESLNQSLTLQFPRHIILSRMPVTNLNEYFYKYYYMILKYFKFSNNCVKKKNRCNT